MKKYSQAGFTLMEIMATVAVGSFLALGFAAILGNSAKNQGEAIELGMIIRTRALLLQALGNTTAWTNTVNDPANQGYPASMSCISQSVACAPDSKAFPGHAFRLLSSNQLLYDGANPNVGLNVRGESCNNFVHSPNPGVVFNGNNDCPFRFELQWYAICTGGADCINPQVMVRAPLLYNPAPSATKLDINLERYSINDFYIRQGPCDVKSRIFTVGAGNFTMPNYTQMYVEVWGGGGGAAGGCLPFWVWTAGTDGQPSNFGPVTATQGLNMPAGSGPQFAAGGTWLIVWMPAAVPFPGAGPGPTAPLSDPIPAVPPPPALTSSCTIGIKSGLGGGRPGNPSSSGTTPSGGGAGTAAFSGIITVSFASELTPAASAGGYSSTLWVNGGGGPAPGTPIAWNVGAGGIGGAGVCQIGPGPPVNVQGGNGGDGLIRISWK